MSINLGGYKFEGPFFDLEEIKKDLGVYVVLCIKDNTPHCILDIGTSEGGEGSKINKRIVTKTGNLQYRLKTHTRKECWDLNKHYKIGYAVLYINDTNERLKIESELKWKYNFACGTNPWKEIEKACEEYKYYEKQFGQRGSYRL